MDEEERANAIRVLGEEPAELYFQVMDGWAGPKDELSPDDQREAERRWMVASAPVLTDRQRARLTGLIGRVDG